MRIYYAPVEHPAPETLDDILSPAAQEWWLELGEGPLGWATDDRDEDNDG